MQHNKQQPGLIDLGTASVETRGVALYNQDTDGGPRDFILGTLAG
ncbi:MAG: benenodin family lasso peptide [Agrobacterium tumefaciens]